MRFGAALGTALKRGARVVASRESAPAYRMIKRALISGPALDRRAGRRPAHAAGAGRQAPAEDAGLRRRVPRRRRVDTIRRRCRSASSSVRASRSPPRCRRRSRSTSRARSCAASRSRDVGVDHLPGPRARDATPSDLLADLDVGGDPRARLPDRRRLRLLGRRATCCRSCSARSASRRSPRTRSSPTPASTAGAARARRSTRRSGSSRRSTPTSARSSTARPSGST